MVVVVDDGTKAVDCFRWFFVGRDNIGSSGKGLAVIFLLPSVVALPPRVCCCCVDVLGVPVFIDLDGPWDVELSLNDGIIFIFFVDGWTVDASFDNDEGRRRRKVVVVVVLVGVALVFVVEFPPHFRRGFNVWNFWFLISVINFVTAIFFDIKLRKLVGGLDRGGVFFFCCC